jgi:predicted ATPase/DNA-binding SARP family transcriptional activator
VNVLVERPVGGQDRALRAGASVRAVDVRLLGPLEVRDGDGALVPVPGGQQRALLVLLALDPGRVVSVDRIVAELWRDDSPAQPTNALHVVVSKLRRALGADAVETVPPGYRLVVDEGAVDASRASLSVARARSAAESGDHARALDELDAALALWRGPVLDEFAELPAARAAAARLDEVRASATEARIDAVLALGRPDDAVAAARAGVHTWPYRERLHAQLMLALYRNGQQVDALRAFADARRVLGEDLGLEPGGELRRLEAAILAHDESLAGPTTRPPTAVAAHPGAVGASFTPVGNLRASLTSFVGREGELSALTDLLGRHRLVTLVGAGGCGKTRLALEHARAVATGLAGGAWFVGLEAVDGPVAVDGAFAAALGVADLDPTGPASGVAPTLADRAVPRLAGRSTLLVVDNCEHVLDAAARVVVDLLERLPDTQVLATSREPLRAPGEAVMVVPPLGREAAVALFTDRARAVSSRVEIDAVAAADLCDGLDGMPLAIELTAARANAFTVEQLLDRLDDRFRPVGGGPRVVLPRHQTLRAVTDWSHDLLFEPERAVFRRLAVFAGGCTLDAAEAVCAGGVVHADDVADIVARLVDKSLVVADRGRYRMLISLAQYARERLVERGEDHEVSSRHAEWFAELALRSFHDWREPGGRDQTWWMGRIAADLDNARRAIDWAVACEDPLAATLAGGLGWYWWHAGRAAEGVERLGAVLAALPDDAADRSLALTWYSRLAVEVGDLGRARDAADAALAAMGDADDVALASLAEAVLTRVAQAEGDLGAARRHARSATAAHEPVDRPWNRGIAGILRATEATLDGDHAAAEDHLSRAIAELGQVGDVAATVIASDALLRSQRTRGATTDATRTARAAAELARRHGLRGWDAMLGVQLGMLAADGGDHDAAQAYLESSAAVADELGLSAVADEARRAVAALGVVSEQIAPPPGGGGGGGGGGGAGGGGGGGG